jgi:hypothetical protein
MYYVCTYIKYFVGPFIIAMGEEGPLDQTTGYMFVYLNAHTSIYICENVNKNSNIYTYVYIHIYEYIHVFMCI